MRVQTKEDSRIESLGGGGKCTISMGGKQKENPQSESAYIRRRGEMR